MDAGNSILSDASMDEKNFALPYAPVDAGKQASAAARPDTGNSSSSVVLTDAEKQALVFELSVA
jgi:hypothetical protein